MSERFFLSNDNDGHWFVVPYSRKQEWNDWLDLDSEDEAAWEAPAWAEPLNTSPSRVSFENWRTE